MLSSKLRLIPFNRARDTKAVWHFDSPGSKRFGETKMSMQSTRLAMPASLPNKKKPRNPHQALRVLLSLRERIEVRAKDSLRVLGCVRVFVLFLRVFLFSSLRSPASVQNRPV